MTVLIGISFPALAGYTPETVYQQSFTDSYVVSQLAIPTNMPLPLDIVQVNPCIVRWYYPEVPYVYDEKFAGQCVWFARTLTQLPYKGDANTWIRYVNSDIPSVRSVVLLNPAGVGYDHLGGVYLTNHCTRTFEYVDQNSCGEYCRATHSISFDDLRIRGYIK